jgi:predicted PP-loop superfamily ATPase
MLQASHHTQQRWRTTEWRATPKSTVAGALTSSASATSSRRFVFCLCSLSSVQTTHIPSQVDALLQIMVLIKDQVADREEDIEG